MKEKNNFIKSMNNIGYTDNGAITLKSSYNKNLDFFFVSGTWGKYSDEEEILKMFKDAYEEDQNLALKNLFNLRDREAKGRRRAFRIIWNKFLTKEVRDKLKKYVPKFGRYDDLLESNLDYVAELLKDKNTENYSLLCKWIPRRTNHFFKLARMLNMSLSSFRKLLSENTKVVESLMCNKEFSKIEYSKVPSLAFKKYKDAFERNDSRRFEMFIERVNKGEDKINVSGITPGDVFKMFISGGNEEVIKSIWKNFDDVISGKVFFPVIDVSGSMRGEPLNNAVGLGIYLSEKNKSSFKDFFITFDENPEFVDLSDCEDIISKFIKTKNANWGGNTNLTKTFKIVLDRAKKDNLKQEDMPDSIIVLSDMEFDYCGRSTNFESIKEEYLKYGYQMPNLVFWNLNGRSGNIVVKENEKGVFMISGVNKNVIKTFMSDGEFSTPKELMESELLSDRYSMIHI